jgi:TPP-dependent pyruvate/acetoin dehydrogenase alpha subunit
MHDVIGGQLQSRCIQRYLLHQMLLIRKVEERIADLYPEQKMRCPVHLCIGQEAVAAGVCAALRADDLVLSNHRSHGHYLAKGGSLTAMMAELYGRATGCTQGKGGSMHLIDRAAGFLGATPIVGSSIPIAVGAAFGSAMQGKPNVTVTFFGDGAAEEGVLHESINFAVLKSLPVVFVCENNFFSVYSPLSVRQPARREIFEIVKGHGIESHQGDGNDAVAVFELAREAVRKARHGSGPTFLEFKTYRWREHCGPGYDNDLGYRPSCDFEEWKGRCPILKLSTRLVRDGLLSDQEIWSMEARLDSEIEEAVQFAKRSPEPSRELLLQHIYAS